MQSLCNKIDDLEVEVQDVEIILLSETWLGESVVQSSLSLKSNGLYRRERSKKTMGVAIYTRLNIAATQCLDLVSRTGNYNSHISIYAFIFSRTLNGTHKLIIKNMIIKAEERFSF